MIRVIGRILAAVLAVALFLAMPAVARAGCTIVQGDFDKNGKPDIRFLGQNTTNEGVTVNVGPASTGVTGCGAKTFNTNFASYYFKLNGGQDTVNFNVVGTWVGIHKNIQVQTGYGTAKVTIGGTGSMTAGSSLVVEVAGMGTTDSVAFAIPKMDDSFLESRMILNPGSDALIVKVDQPLTGGSVVKIDADLGGDPNSFKFTQTALIDAAVEINVIGGIKNDSGTFTLAGPVSPRGRLMFRTEFLAGNDTFDGQVSLPLFRIAAGGEVRVDVAGGAGDDVLLFSRKGTTATGSTVNDGLLDVFLDGGGANDTITTDLAGNGFVLDGTIRIREDGGTGSDKLTALVDVQAASGTPNLDVVLLGGSGSDKVNATINDNGPRLPGNYGKVGAAILDGGLDPNDTCTAAGTGLMHKRNCEN